MPIDEHSGELHVKDQSPTNEDSQNEDTLQEMDEKILLYIIIVLRIFTYTPVILSSLKIIDYNDFVWNLYFMAACVYPFVYVLWRKDFRSFLKRRTTFQPNIQ